MLIKALAAAAGNFGGEYTIDNSLRFNDNDSAYLSRTPSVAGNRKTWTWSGWVKRGNIVALTTGIFNANTTTSSDNECSLFFRDTSVLQFSFNNSGVNIGLLQTSQVFRDVSGWYHIIIVFDTGSATASERMKIYVNGARVTNFTAETYPPLNAESVFNSAIPHSISALRPTSPSEFFDGYLAEINFIDGQALTANSFGQIDATTGEWSPIPYAGTYGTNGFYIKGDAVDGITENSVDGSFATNGGITSVFDATKQRNVASFDGVDDFVLTPYTSNYTDFTVSVFFKYDGGSGNLLNTIFSKNSFFAATTSDFPFYITVNDTNNTLSANYDAGGDFVGDLTQTATGLSTDTWYHVAVTYDRNGSSILYLNGIAVQTNGSVNISNTSRNWCIGRGSFPQGGGVGESEFKGDMYDARLYSRALSSSEVQDLYNETNQSESGLVFNYKFIESSQNPSIVDYSSNGNNWTASSIGDQDVMISTPTNNFSVFNVLSMGSTFSNVQEGNLEFYRSSATSSASAGTMAVSSGKYYYEIYLVSRGSTGASFAVGIQDSSLSLSVVNGYAYYFLNGQFLTFGAGSAYGSTLVAGDILGVAYDLDAGTLTFYKNGVSLGVATSSLTSASYIPLFVDGGGNNVSLYSSTQVLNFGADSSFAGNKTRQGNTDANGIGDFYYEPPAGYLALCTENLPAPAIEQPETQFNVVTYTGDGTDDKAITGVGFQPDMVWIKSRSNALSHNIYDSVRGVSKRIQPNLTNAESSPISGVKSFDADGFTLGNDTDDTNFTSGVTYVAWCWKAGGTAVSNTDGSITSQVSVNTDAGFSVVSYTATNNSSNVGHGLSQAPELIIFKSRTSASSWSVYTTAVDGTYDYLGLNLTDAKGDSVLTAPSSSVMYVNNTEFAGTNVGSDNYIAYAFHSVEGFSKFGSYVGNGSANGTFVYTGVKIAFLLIKKTNSTSNWTMIDNERSGYNGKNDLLYADGTAAEYSGATYPYLEILSNGFKCRTTEASVNASGSTYIYMAFAEHPFKYATGR